MCMSKLLAPTKELVLPPVAFAGRTLVGGTLVVVLGAPDAAQPPTPPNCPPMLVPSPPMRPWLETP